MKNYLITNYKIFLIILFITGISTLSNGCNKNIVKTDFAGLWQGPHPELAHIKFILHIQESTAEELQGEGYWVNQNIVQKQFPIDSINVEDDEIHIFIGCWNCIYSGKLDASSSNINGYFGCMGEKPDSISLTRALPHQVLGMCQQAQDSSLTYSLPFREENGLQVADVTGTSIVSEILTDIIAEIGREVYGRYHSFLLVKNGKLVAERYFYGFERDDLHPLESVTKSVVSLLSGILYDQGKLGALESPVSNFFPSDIISQDFDKIHIRHLLTMSSGLKTNDQEMIQRTNRLTYLLNLHSTETPGLQFRYQAANAELLGAIIKKVSGQFTDTFAREHLFKPLGISRYDWETFKQDGYPLCSGALWLRPRDMAKIGQLVLNRGHWNVKQIVPTGWITESTRQQIETGIGKDNYSYQWWISDIPSGNRKYKLVWANGLGSQFIFIFPELNIVIVTTGGNWAGGNDGRSWDIFKMLEKYLYRLIKNGV